MTPQDTGSVVAIVAALVGAYIAWRKYRPETNDITVTTANQVNAMTLRFAGAVDEDNDDLRERLKALSDEFAQYRTDTDARLTELSAQLRAETAQRRRFEQEAGQLEVENSRLRGRVDELENEVARLKAR